MSLRGSEMPRQPRSLASAYVYVMCLSCWGCLRSVDMIRKDPWDWQEPGQPAVALQRCMLSSFTSSSFSPRNRHINFYWHGKQARTRDTQELREIMAVLAAYPLWALLTFLIAVSNLTLFNFVGQKQWIVRWQRCVCPHWNHWVIKQLHQYYTYAAS